MNGKLTAIAALTLFTAASPLLATSAEAAGGYSRGYYRSYGYAPLSRSYAYAPRLYRSYGYYSGGYDSRFYGTRVGANSN